MSSRLGRGHARTLKAVGAQGISSATNLLFGASTVVLLPRDELGTVGLYSSVYLLLLGLSRGFAVADANLAPIPLWRVVAYISVPCASIAVICAMVFDTPYGIQTAVAASLTFPLLARHEVLRTEAFYEDAAGRALVLDVAWLAVSVCSAASLTLVEATPTTLWVMWAAGSASSLLFERRGRLSEDLRSSVSLPRMHLLSAADFVLAGGSFILLSAAALTGGGAGVLGDYRAAQLVVSVPQLVQAPLSIVALGRMRRSLEPPIVVARRWSFALVGVSLAAYFVFRLVPAQFWEGIPGDNSYAIASLGDELLLANAVTAAAIGAIALLRSTSAYVPLIAVRIIYLASLTATTFALSARLGSIGIGYAVLASGCAYALASWAAAYRASLQRPHDRWLD